MYKIAICEDDLYYMECNSAKIRRILQEENLQEEKDFIIDNYDDPDKLVDKVILVPDEYQLLLMDIMLGGRNGVEVAMRLRKKQVKCGIIYITAYPGYVFQSFSTRPLQYLLKPVDIWKLRTAVMDNYREQQGERQLLVLNGVSMPIPLENIFYLESYRHKIEVHLRDRVVCGNGPMTAVEVSLPSKFFCRCHIGYVVNLAHVFDIQRYSITLDDGRSIPVSRRLYRQTADKYIAYLKD